uniref:Complexin-1 n=1 Tax=Syphacia muris TaxID=451379 RepID=A0A0N5AYN9_9BILA
MEAEREKMRQNIRDKYNIRKKEDGIPFDMTPGRIGTGLKKTPEELSREMNEEDDSIIGQLGLTEQVEKAKTAVTGALEAVKGFLSFGK